MPSETIDITSENIKMTIATINGTEQKREDPLLVTFDEPYDPNKSVYNHMSHTNER